MIRFAKLSIILDKTKDFAMNSLSFLADTMYIPP